MRLQVVVAVLCYVTLCALASDEKDEPMVAFVCDRPSMYLTDRGWMKDDSTPCLRDPVDILNYCRKVFPNLDVRNVVESNEKVTISNWCAFGHSTCSHKFTVTPYRCLVGPFQSDALLVPEHCVFDHVHNAKLCTSFAEWNKTASRSCFTRDMELQSFSMLQPCGIDKFNGVEFVCCPRASDAGTTVKTATTKPVKPVTTVKPEEDPFSAYLNRIGGTQNGHKWNEHDYYVKAMEDMHHIHQDKLTRIMKEWAAARQHVQDMKARDPKAAEKLNKDITMRFQKTYEALEVESTLEKKQLSSLHQQRVQAELNDKKRRALDEYMLAIDDNNDPAEILRSLKHYIKAVQKDRLHTVNRYKHLRDTDPAEAEALRLDMADHLRTIDQQLNIAIGMLDRVPKYKKKVQLQIDDYLDAYHAIDTSVAVLMRSLIDNPPSTTPLPSSQDLNIEHVAGQESPVDDDDDDDDDNDNDDDEDDEEEEDEDDDDEYKGADSKYQYDDEVEDEDESVKDVKVSKTPERIEDKETDADEYDSEENDDEKKEIDSKDNVDKKVDESEDSDEDSYESDDNDEDDVLLASTTPMSVQSPTTTHRPLPREMDELDFIEANVEMIHGPYAAHADKSILSAKESLIQKMPVKGMNSFNAAVPLGIVIGTITVLAVIMAGVVVARRRSHQRLRTAVNVRLDPAATPEERHIATMQMNGYENPTYKYFESSGTATA